MDTHASVWPDIKNQDAFVGTISVDGHNTIARAKKERERERERKQILSTPSGPLFIKRDGIPRSSGRAKFDGSYVGQEGNRGAPLRIRLFIHPSAVSPTIISFP